MRYRKMIRAAMFAVAALGLSACGSSSSSAVTAAAEKTTVSAAAEVTVSAAEEMTETVGEKAPSASETAEENAETAVTEAAAEGSAESETTAEETGTAETITTKQLEALAAEGMQTKIAADPMVISLACSTPSEGTIVGEAFSKAIEAVSEWTDGNVEIRFYSDGMVGTDAETMEGLQIGILDAVFSSAASQTEMMPELAILDIGGLYTDLDTVNRVIGDFRDEFDSIYSENGFYLASIYAPSFRVLSVNREILSAEDLKGLKIRTQESSCQMTFWNVLGCTAVPLEYSDLSAALQQGTVDAEENPAALIVASGLDQLQSCIVKTDHLPFVSTLVANQSWYDSLSDAQRLVFDQFAEYAERYIMAGAALEEEESYAACRAEGILVTEVPEDIRAMYPEAARSVIDELKQSGDVDADLVDRYVKAAGFNDP